MLYLSNSTVQYFPTPMSSCTPTPRPAPGRPKDLAKGLAILEAAKCMFLEHGFEGAGMDQIAARAGVSKLTVYNHFGDKEALFIAAVEHYCEEQVPPALFTPVPEQPLRERLLDIARALYALMSSPEAVAGFRLMCTLANRDPSLPEKFWNAGAGHLQEGFADLLDRRTAAGELSVDDPVRAAAQFFALLRGDIHPRLVIGCDVLPGFDVEAHVAATVDLCLQAWSRRA